MAARPRFHLLTDKRMSTLVFSSIPFLFMYLPVVLILYYITPRKFRNLLLLIVNLIFYGWGEPVFIFVMIFSIISNYIHGIFIHKNRENKKVAKRFLISAILINVALLGFFKYTTFLGNTLKALLPFFSSMDVPLIPLPIGISFYTFEALSYIIDVYRDDCPVQKNIVSFGAFIALFPRLIAGPIVKYRDVAEQVDRRQESSSQFAKGIRIFLIGLAKKVLIANPMGLLWDSLRKTSEANGVLGSWVGIIAFTFQIYFDFSGYSDMAIGLGNMLGFDFLKNFNYPYISKSITEFWRRWHISLSTWFKEYVYIPLGGNRKGQARLIINLLIVWFLTGLWHGASWNFVLWGMYFGVILILEKLFLLKRLERLPGWVQHIYALAFIVLGWVIFYFGDTAQMFSFFGSLFNPAGGAIGANALALTLQYLPLLIVAALASTPLARKVYDRIKESKAIPYVEFALCALALVLCTAAIVNQSYNPFLYFRF